MQISENSKYPTEIGTVVAFDADSGSFGDVKYSLSGLNSEHFSIYTSQSRVRSAFLSYKYCEKITPFSPNTIQPPIFIMKTSFLFMNRSGGGQGVRPLPPPLEKTQTYKVSKQYWS